jgi:hypothetical protein
MYVYSSKHSRYAFYSIQLPEIKKTCFLYGSENIQVEIASQHPVQKY